MDEKLQKHFNNLKQKRDELKVKLNLGEKEIKSAWKDFEQDWKKVQQKAKQFKSDAEKTGQQIGEEFKNAMQSAEEGLTELREKYIE